jgi:hypothetical protein
VALCVSLALRALKAWRWASSGMSRDTVMCCYAAAAAAASVVLVHVWGCTTCCAACCSTPNHSCTSAAAAAAAATAARACLGLYHLSGGALLSLQDVTDASLLLQVGAVQQDEAEPTHQACIRISMLRCQQNQNIQHVAVSPHAAQLLQYAAPLMRGLVTLLPAAGKPAVTAMRCRRLHQVVVAAAAAAAAAAASAAARPCQRWRLTATRCCWWRALFTATWMRMPFR